MLGVEGDAEALFAVLHLALPLAAVAEAAQPRVCDDVILELDQGAAQPGLQVTPHLLPLKVERPVILFAPEI